MLCLLSFLFLIKYFYFRNLDRKKDLVKLRGGEYLSPTKVETSINKLSIIENSCLCVSSESEYPVALICPKAKEIQVSLTELSNRKIQLNIIYLFF